MESPTTLIGGSSCSGGQSISIPVSVSASDNNNTNLQQSGQVRVRSRRPFWNGLRTNSDRSSKSNSSLSRNEETKNTKTGGRSWRSFIKRDSAVSSSSRSSRSSTASVKSMGNTPVSCMDATDEESKPNALVSVAVTNAEEPPSVPRSNGNGPIQFVLSVASKIGEAIERLLLVDETTSEPVIRERAIPGGVMLEGCQTKDEHFQRHDSVIDAIQELKGEHGLRAVGFEMRFVPCEEHANTITTAPQADMWRKQSQLHHRKSWDETTNVNDDTPEHDESSVSDVESPLAGGNQFTNSLASTTTWCDRCVTRLFYNGTPVDETNRRRYVSDGKMYDEISRLCMEHAQDVMISEGNLEWKSIEMDIQVLASKSMDWSRPTLLFVTGRGKVRAGIFSRKHILTTGMEPSTAIATVREAKSRNMNIIMLDPNCRGERQAYTVVERSMSHVFSHLKQNCNENNNADIKQGAIFFQVHSASGAHVVCSLMDNCDSYLPHVRAIAFTDSTHNIQWTRKEQHRALYILLESSSAVYFRSSKGDAAHPAGLEVSNHDAEWVRRFGKIRTVWAGTTEHSLSDWCARHHIWSHFDMHLTRD